MQERYRFTGVGLAKRHGDDEGTEHLSLEERVRKLRLYSTKRRFGEDLINVYKNLMRENEEEGAGLFSVVLSDRTGGSGQKLKQMVILGGPFQSQQSCNSVVLSCNIG